MEIPAVGPYRVLGKLGAGGMGDVYLAEDPRLGRKVALKCLSSDRVQTPEARDRLLREARAAAQLNHPNIAAIYDILQEDGQSHIVMEYVPGETLAALLQRGRPSHERALDIGIQLADALIEAHARGIIHRDLKPANVHLTPDGRVKVLDFGLAKAAPVTTTTAAADALGGPETAAGEILGTPGYMAPEQLLGQPCDARGDIYSLGVILFELFGGRRPFTGSDVFEQARAVLSGHVADLRDSNPLVPDEIRAVVEKSLALSPQDRYQTATDLARELRLINDALSARPTGASQPARRRWTRGRRALVVAGVLAAIVIGAVTFRRVRPPSSPNPTAPAGPPVIAVLPFISVMRDEDVEALAAGLTSTLSARLGSIPGVNVVAPSATAKYAGATRDVAAAGRELGATFLVDGSVRGAGDDVSVAVNVYRAGSTILAWGGAFSGKLRTPLGLQQELGERLSRGLQRVGIFPVALSAADEARLASPPTTDQDAFAEYAQARTFLERPDVPGHLDHAMRLLETATGRDPKFALAWAALGEARWLKYGETRDVSFVDGARRAMLEGLRLDPRQPGVRYALALIYYGTGETAQALEELRHVIAMQPADDDAHRLIGEILVNQGKTDEGLAELMRAITLRPDYWDNHASLGLAYYDTGRYPDAVSAFSRLTELQPDSAWGFQMLGTAYHIQDRLDEALRNYKAANAIARTATAYSGIGTIHYWNGRYRDALDAYLEAAQLEPTSPTTQMNIGDAQRHLGAPRLAEKAYETAIALCTANLKVNPADASTVALRALSAAKLGRHADAAADMTRARALAPKENRVLYKMAAVQALAGDAPGAMESLDQALRAGYSAAYAARDEDLARLRTLPAFRDVLRRTP